MIILAARAMLASLTPLRTDCGALCGAACCQCDEDGQGGVYLFPGEAALYADCTWAHVVQTPAWDGGMLVCDRFCDRADRPFGCRIFPLTPVLRADGWDVRLDRRAWAVCPLMRGGSRGLDPAFVGAARAAVQLLATAPETLEALQRWVSIERMYRQTL